MTRGRKKDLTIPPSRTLVQQRDYRARKATYIASLEERCRKSEEENEALRKELADTRARLANPALLLPETAEASTELLTNLRAATASLAKFQGLAFSRAQTFAEPVSNANELQQAERLEQARPSVVDARQASQMVSQSPKTTSNGRKRLFTETTPPFSPQPTSFRSISPDSEECCGGILDCDALDCDGIFEQEGGRPGGKISRLSGMRSTSDYRLQDP